MAATTLSTLANTLLQNYGAAIVQAFTAFGPDNQLVNSQSIMGRLQARGRIKIGGTDEISDRYAGEWGVYTTAPVASSFDVNDAYPASTPLASVAASIPWKRNGVPLEVDNLVRTISASSFRGNKHQIAEEMRIKIGSIIHAVEAQLALDGTGNGGKDFTGFKAPLSATNTYAGINQNVAAYWRATVVPAGGGALSRAFLNTAAAALHAKGVLSPRYEMWMGSGQWYRYANLYLAQLRGSGQAGGAMGGAGDYVPPVYTDGLCEIPIYVLPSMPNDEVWIVNPDGCKLQFADQVPQDGTDLKQDGLTQTMVTGVPVAIEDVFTGRDTKAAFLKIYGNLIVRSPRDHAAITGLAV